MGEGGLGMNKMSLLHFCTYGSIQVLMYHMTKGLRGGLYPLSIPWIHRRKDPIIDPPLKNSSFTPLNCSFDPCGKSSVLETLEHFTKY